MTAEVSARSDGRVPCPHCSYSAEPRSSIAGHVAMRHPEVPMDAIAPKRRVGRIEDLEPEHDANCPEGLHAHVFAPATPDSDDQHWLDEQVARLGDGIEAARAIWSNWREGRCVGRLHPDQTPGEYIASLGLRLTLAEAMAALPDGSTREVARVAGVGVMTVQDARVRNRTPAAEPARVIGADGRSYPARVVRAVVIDTPMEEGPLDAPAGPRPPERNRDRMIANANRDRFARGLALVEGTVAGLADLNFPALTSIATPADLAGWTRQIAAVSSALRTIRRSIEKG